MIRTPNSTLRFFSQTRSHDGAIRSTAPATSRMEGVVRSASHEMIPSAVIALLMATLSACATLDRDQAGVGKPARRENRAVRARATRAEHRCRPASPRRRRHGDEAGRHRPLRNAAFAGALARSGSPAPMSYRRGCCRIRCSRPVPARREAARVRREADGGGAAAAPEAPRGRAGRSGSDRRAIVQSGLDVVRDVASAGEARRAATRPARRGGHASSRGSSRSRTRSDRPRRQRMDVATARADAAWRARSRHVSTADRRRRGAPAGVDGLAPATSPAVRRRGQCVART